MTKKTQSSVADQSRAIWVLAGIALAVGLTLNLEGPSLLIALFAESVFFMVLAWRRSFIWHLILGDVLWVGVFFYFLVQVGRFQLFNEHGVLDIFDSFFDIIIAAVYYWNGHNPYALNIEGLIFGTVVSLITLILLNLSLPTLTNVRFYPMARKVVGLFFITLMVFCSMFFLGDIYFAPLYLGGIGFLVLSTYVKFPGAKFSLLAGCFLTLLSCVSFYCYSYTKEALTTERDIALSVGTTVNCFCLFVAFIFYVKHKSFQGKCLALFYFALCLLVSLRAWGV